MSRVLAATVVLTDEDGLPVVLSAGTVPTKAQAAKITNPHAWADAPAEEIEVEEPAAEDEVADSAEDEAPAADDEVSEPPAPQDDDVKDEDEDEAPAKSRKRS